MLSVKAETPPPIACILAAKMVAVERGRRARQLSILCAEQAEATTGEREPSISSESLKEVKVVFCHF